MKRLIVLLLVLMAGRLFAIDPALNTKFKAIDSALVSGDLGKAASLIENLSYAGVGYAGSDEVKIFTSYQNSSAVLLAIKNLQDARDIFDKSNMESRDISSLTDYFNHFASAWKTLTTTPLFNISNELLNRVNQAKTDAKSILNLAQSNFETAENKRAEIAQAQKAAEEKQKADDEKNGAEAAQADHDAQITKIESLDQAVKKLGYKGLYRDSGIVTFLFACRQYKDLASGVGFVFWTGIPSLNNSDGFWKLDEVVGGWEIYNNENILTEIAIKAKSNRQVIGQHLESQFFVLTQTIKLTTASGAVLTIPAFKPVDGVHE